MMPLLANEQSLEENALVEAALAGEASALEHLVRRLQPWLYNVVVRMVWEPSEAEDLTQEILIKIVTHLGSFQGQSSVRTWAWRIASNHIRNWRRSRTEQVVHDFECYGRALQNTPDSAVSAPPEEALLVEEAKLGCTLGMLLCLDREQRLIFVLADIFEVEDAAGAEVVGLTHENYRQKLARARAQLRSFLAGQCGLVDPTRPCRCARKTRGFVQAGIVDVHNRRFAKAHLETVQAVAPRRAQQIQAASEGWLAALYREHPFFEPPDFAARIRALAAEADCTRENGTGNSN